MGDLDGRTWYRAIDRIRVELTPKQYQDSGLHFNEPEVNQMISGYNFRTFPKTYRWEDQHKTIWRKAGLSVFDFRLHPSETTGGDYRIPTGIIVMRRKLGNKILFLRCQVLSAYPNDRLESDMTTVESEVAQKSTVCGRAELRFLRHQLKDRVKRKPGALQDKTS